LRRLELIHPPEELTIIKDKLRMTACKIVGSILNEH